MIKAGQNGKYRDVLRNKEVIGTVFAVVKIIDSQIKEDIGKNVVYLTEGENCVPYQIFEEGLELIPDAPTTPKLIKTWKELSEETSPTHVINIDLEGGYGWVIPKIDDPESWDGKHYLSTHTFYGKSHEYYTRLLQSCGFNVVLDNWDKNYIEYSQK